MNNKQLYKKVKRKIKGFINNDLDYVVNVISILILFYVSKQENNSIKKIKEAIKMIDLDNDDKSNDTKHLINKIANNSFKLKKTEINQFLDIISSFDDLYIFSKNKEIKFEYFFNQDCFDQKKHNDSVQNFSKLLKKIKTFNNKTISYLDYNYYLIIEFVRDSIEGFNYGY